MDVGLFTFLFKILKVILLVDKNLKASHLKLTKLISETGIPMS